MYVIIPNTQLHHHQVSAKTFIWSTKNMDINVHMTWQQKTAVIANTASEYGRGAVLSNDIRKLEMLCRKYGGVVQSIKTGQVIGMYTQGEELVKNYDNIDIKSMHNVKNITYINGVINDMRVTYIMDNKQKVIYVSCLTDIPEVIELLGYRAFTQ